MNLELKKELPILGIVLTPFVYLAIIWDGLPQRVPIHWNYKGEIDNWGDKFSLIFISFAGFNVCFDDFYSTYRS